MIEEHVEPEVEKEAPAEEVEVNEFTVESITITTTTTEDPEESPVMRLRRKSRKL